MATLPCRHLLIAAAWALLAPATASAQEYAFETLALEGDPAPPPVQGAMYRFERRMDLDADGRVSFVANIGPVDPAEQVIAVHDGVSLHAAVHNLDPAPAPISTPFLALANPRLGSGGDLAWQGNYYSPFPTTQEGVFARLGGTNLALLLEGQTLAGGGTVERIHTLFEMNAAGDLLVEAVLDVDGSEKTALLLARATGVEIVAREGDPTPAGGVFGPLSLTSLPSLGDDGSVAFIGPVTGTSASQAAVFLRSPSGALSVLLEQGTPLQTPRGGTVLQFGGIVRNPASHLIALVGVLRSPPSNFSDAIVVIGESHHEIIATEDVLPGMDGERFARADWMAVNAAGDVLLLVASDETNREGLYVWRGDELNLVLRLGDPLPGHPGEVVTGIVEAALNDAGQIAFEASGSQVGFFLATPVVPEVPLAPPLALGALAALIIASGGELSRRRRGPRIFRSRDAD